MVLNFISNSQELIDYLSTAPVCHVWINGVETIVYTGEDIPVTPVAEE